jgi:REP element-mobilizing transposase RayT
MPEKAFWLFKGRTVCEIVTLGIRKTRFGTEIWVDGFHVVTIGRSEHWDIVKKYLQHEPR